MSTKYYHDYEEWKKDAEDQGLSLVRDEFRSECFDGEPLRANLRGYYSGDPREQFGWINEPLERSNAMKKETSKKVEATDVKKMEAVPKGSMRCPSCGTLNAVSRMSCTNCKTRLYKGDDGNLKGKSMTELVNMYNELSGAEPVKKFQDKETAVKRVEALLKEKSKTKKKEKRVAEKKEQGPKKVSKFGIIREMFVEKKSWTLDEIVKRSGFDQQNVMTAMSILRNPTRTGADKMLTTDYDRATKTFTLMK
jgi:hypothetical protein